MFKIEKGIPIPQKGMTRDIRLTLEKMEVGDSFAIELKEEKEKIIKRNAGNAINILRKRMPERKYVTKTVKENNQRRFRVWRAK